MYGYRARIGYTSPPYLTETFPYEFYKIVPKGITLVLTTLAVAKFTDREVEKSVEMSLEAAREMGRAGVNLIVLGGVPLNLSRGYDGLQLMIQETERDTGVPVTSSLTAQMNALHALGARKVAVVHPFEQSHGRYGEYLAHYGFEMVGVKGAGKKVGDLALTSSEISLDLARTLHRSHPDADTFYFPAPHWGIATAIEPLERELGLNVVTALQALVWESLRRCKIEDRIDDFGRLLKDH